MVFKKIDILGMGLNSVEAAPVIMAIPQWYSIKISTQSNSIEDLRTLRTAVFHPGIVSVSHHVMTEGSYIVLPELIHM